MGSFFSPSLSLSTPRLFLFRRPLSTLSLNQFQAAPQGHYKDNNGVCPEMNSFFSKKCFKVEFQLNFHTFPPLPSQTKSHPTGHQSLKGHRVLDLITPKSNFTGNGRQSHLRLIQDILSSNLNNPGEYVGPYISYSNSNSGPFSVSASQGRVES